MPALYDIQDEVDRMVNEADRFASEDKAKREAVETKNNAESMVYQTEKQLKELGDKVRQGDEWWLSVTE